MSQEIELVGLLQVLEAVLAIRSWTPRSVLGKPVRVELNIVVKATMGLVLLAFLGWTVEGPTGAAISHVKGCEGKIYALGARKTASIIWRIRFRESKTRIGLVARLRH